jgi:arsenite methyltransferase
MLQFDAEASRRVEATYTTPDVVEQRQAVQGALELSPGERVVRAHGAGQFGPLAVSVDGSMFWLARNRLSGS